MSSLDDKIKIELSRADATSLLTSMHWTLPDLGNDTQVERERSAHSERCFRAQRILRAALIGEPVVG